MARAGALFTPLDTARRGSLAPTPPHRDREESRRKSPVQDSVYSPNAARVDGAGAAGLRWFRKSRRLKCSRRGVDGHAFGRLTTPGRKAHADAGQNQQDRPPAQPDRRTGLTRRQHEETKDEQDAAGHQTPPLTASRRQQIERKEDQSHAGKENGRQRFGPDNAYAQRNHNSQDQHEAAGDDGPPIL